jgi:molybdopterin synthase catalytic subunit
MQISLTDSVLDPWDAIQQYQQQLPAGSYGATAVFLGSMRDFNLGDRVQAMHLEHYPGMTERELEAICQEAAARWHVPDGLLIHRVGEIQPGDTIVVIAVWSVHRDAAFQACRYIIEQLKTRATFWKKEKLLDGERWVDATAAGEPDQD